jgi:hypothetical protein
MCDCAIFHKRPMIMKVTLQSILRIAVFPSGISLETRGSAVRQMETNTY